MRITPDTLETTLTIIIVSETPGFLVVVVVVVASETYGVVVTSEREFCKFKNNIKKMRSKESKNNFPN